MNIFDETDWATMMPCSRRRSLSQINRGWRATNEFIGFSRMYVPPAATNSNMHSTLLKGFNWSSHTSGNHNSKKSQPVIQHICGLKTFWTLELLDVSLLPFLTEIKFSLPRGVIKLLPVDPLFTGTHDEHTTARTPMAASNSACNIKWIHNLGLKREGGNDIKLVSYKSIV